MIGPEMTETWWSALLREQQASGFADFTGADGTVVVPVSDRLITRILAGRIPASAPVREVVVRALANNLVEARVRLAKPAILPAITIRLLIARQPQLPDSPVLVLNVVSQGLAAVAGPVMRFLDMLPTWIRMDGDRLFVDLRALLAQHGAAAVLDYLSDLQLTTTEGRFVIRARATLPPQR